MNLPAFLLLACAGASLAGAELAFDPQSLTVDLRSGPPATPPTLAFWSAGTKPLTVTATAKAPLTVPATALSAGRPGAAGRLQLGFEAGHIMFERCFDLAQVEIRLTSDEAGAPVYVVPVTLRFHRRPELVPRRPQIEADGTAGRCTFTLTSPDPAEPIRTVALATMVGANGVPAKAGFTFTYGEAGRCSIVWDAIPTESCLLRLRIEYAAPLAASKLLLLPVSPPGVHRPSLPPKPAASADPAAPAPGPVPLPASAPGKQQVTLE